MLANFGPFEENNGGIETMIDAPQSGRRSRGLGFVRQLTQNLAADEGSLSKLRSADMPVEIEACRVHRSPYGLDSTLRGPRSCGKYRDIGLYAAATCAGVLIAWLMENRVRSGTEQHIYTQTQKWFRHHLYN